MKKAFTLVELLLVIAVLAILSGAAYIGIQKSQYRVTNEKLVDDLTAIENAIERFNDDDGTYPIPATGEDKNVLCFKADTSYIHCPDDIALDPGDVAFVQAMVDNNLLTKRYLQEVPTDPRTGSRYVYSVTSDGRYYQVAGVIDEDGDGNFLAKMVGNIDEEGRLLSLIRSYDGPDFVTDGSSNNLPYSPDPDKISAKVLETGTVYYPGETIGPENKDVTIYFSDGSITHLDAGSVMDFLEASEVAQNDEDGIITKISVELKSGKIWNKVARLAQESEFNVETTSAIAGVRGTEFGVDADNNLLTILSGEIEFDGGQIVDSDGAELAEVVMPDIGDNTPLGPPTIYTTVDPEWGSVQNNYYPTPFNNNVVPRVIEIDTTQVPGSITFEYYPDVDVINILDGDGNDYGVNLESVSLDEPNDVITANVENAKDLGDVRFQFESPSEEVSGHSNPAISIVDSTLLTEAMLYNLLADNDGQSQQNQNCNGSPVSINILGPANVIGGQQHGYQLIMTDDNACDTELNLDAHCSAPPYTNLSPDMLSVDGTAQTSLNEQISCTYNLLDASIPVSVYAALHHTCLGDDFVEDGNDIGYWENNSCWVLADPDTNCDLTCGNTVGGICEDESDGDLDWDTNDAICTAVTGFPLFGQGGMTQTFAPHFQPGLNRCYSRNVGIGNILTPNLCGTTANMVGQNRICRCQ